MILFLRLDPAAWSRHVTRETEVAESRSSFLILSNSRELKLGLLICSQTPKNNTVSLGAQRYVAAQKVKQQKMRPIVGTEPIAV